jgi:hypothetical protein
MGKQRLSIAVISIALALCGCTKTPEAKLVGEWQGTDETGHSASMIFNRDHSFRMMIGNMLFDESTFSGVKVEWRIDVSHDPIWLNVVMSGSGKELVLPMIIRFVTDQKILVRMPSDLSDFPNPSGSQPTRPTGFATSMQDAADQMVLAKVR